MKSKIAEDLGRLFEVGFNIGILACIKEKQIKHNFGNLYLQELQELKFPKMLRKITDKITSPLERKMAEKWSTFFLQKGFLSGLNFFREYLQSTGWNETNKLRHLEILYYQSCFCDESSIGTYAKGYEQWCGEVISQFDQIDNISQYIGSYKGKGEFLRADTLIFLRYGRQFRILCVDLSVFSIRTSEDVTNLDYLEIIRRLLRRDINYLRSKSVFSKLRIDTESCDVEFSEGLKSYFTAFKYDDKESAKSIQAGGYAYSFYQFLREIGILAEDSRLIFNAVGYSDRGISTMSVRPENLDVLKTCYSIYKYDSSPQEIVDARKLVLNKIKRSACYSFDQGKKLVDDILAMSADKINVVRHPERLEGFVNSAGIVPDELMQQLGLSGGLSLRNAHAKLIEKALESAATYIFLTGNPGIGKTTAIAKFLTDHVNDGFLFFYVSPRKQVNLDIIDKFKKPGTEDLWNDKILAINTYSDLIKDSGHKYTVQYLSNQRHGKFGLQVVNFQDSRETKRQNRRSDRLKRQTENVIEDGGRNTKGVLNSICEAISTLIDTKDFNNIVATVSIQSLKKTDAGDTLKHFEKIFRNAYNTKLGEVLPDRMKDISSRIKHLFIMIDEITGDEGGVEFLNGINNILNTYELKNNAHGFNTKVIVADASIVDKAVISQHLSDTSAEPDKIYFRKAKNPGSPLSVENFKFKDTDATVINTNSYPAKSLSITYKVFIESCKFSEDTLLDRETDLTKTVQGEILQDIEALLQRSDVEQVIVYIQDKQKLGNLIDKIREHRGKFEKGTDYIEIHANIGEEEKELVQKWKKDAKVVFMTASGSRGLSFPKAKHILVEIPRFEIEKNLMELIQVIYRGRGKDEIDNQDKELIFYLGDRVVYFEDNKEISIQESKLSLLNILLILKASIMTRIYGCGQIGSDKFIIIPIGGKSVFAAGETFSSQMKNLIDKLKSEHRKNRSDRRLPQVYDSLEDLLGQADFTLRENVESNSKSQTSYLSQRDFFNNGFSQLVSESFEKLLNLNNLEMGYMSGGLLVVPIASQTLEETYIMPLATIAKNANSELWHNMQIISYASAYSEDLQFAIKDAMELVKELTNSVDKTQRFEQSSQRKDRYYALPLFAFIAGEVFREYFASNPQEQKYQDFRNILTQYIKALYPVGNVLPIGDKYQDFPFVVFRSYSLEQIREKIFTDKYLLSSNELNVLNLVLSKEI
ncbi:MULTISPECIES: helicase-related protein [unclassified Microcoleus]|uniref:helicase-related protein n=1 Tax=unclassified Microcoleus TaxID=2642155 RepID=UPI001D8B8399|nr:MULTISPECIES: helicase-related protein [unclassified Microcoleus]MCC3440717.1 helicase [Microcoleus sp. PH2017_03_ELD_O_A]MCC3466121.1 helicase [Microcoleus sp. PH2017_06_SFM_O_A]MCC3502205.1 helicase [Microcoleus sp. PH2017_19_SFW_U_A]TAE12585.1 MAG: helicase [Oscillatoriales cyanobacterium]MCC3411459.1 helicase [Microcoleus sp. PH2017_02_FOX_O_A]